MTMADHDALRSRLIAKAWFTAERASDGSRILLRGRKLDREDYCGALFPTVVTIEHSFPVQRQDGLPTKQQHTEYQEATLALAEAVEAAGLGFHVLGETTQGTVREWLYVRDLPAVAELCSQHLKGRIDFELCYDDDPSWAFVDAAIEQIRGEQWG